MNELHVSGNIFAIVDEDEKHGHIFYVKNPSNQQKVPIHSKNTNSDDFRRLADFIDTFNKNDSYEEFVRTEKYNILTIIIEHDINLNIDIYDPYGNKDIFNLFDTHGVKCTVSKVNEEYLINIKPQKFKLPLHKFNNLIGIVTFYSDDLINIIPESFGEYQLFPQRGV